MLLTCALHAFFAWNSAHMATTCGLLSDERLILTALLVGVDVRVAVGRTVDGLDLDLDLAACGLSTQLDLERSNFAGLHM